MDDFIRYAVGISSALIVYGYIHILVRLNIDFSPAKAMQLIIGIVLNIYFIVCVIKNQEPEYFIVACWALLVFVQIINRASQNKTN